MEKIKCVKANELLCKPLSQRGYIWDGLLPTGLHIF